MMRKARYAVALLAALGSATPGVVSAHPCEDGVAQATQKLSYENQQILAMEMSGNSTLAQALRREHTYRVQLLVQLCRRSASRASATRSRARRRPGQGRVAGRTPTARVTGSVSRARASIARKHA